MKTSTLIITALLALASLGANAQTNAAASQSVLSLTNNVTTQDKTLYDLYLGADGTVDRHSGANEEFAISLASNPIKSQRLLWIELTQGVSWKPFAGSTDLDAEWQFELKKDTIYVLPCWSGGTTYGRGAGTWRTGPMAIEQYYVSEKAFIYAQENVDFVTHGSVGLRWSIGTGIEF